MAVKRQRPSLRLIWMIPAGIALLAGLNAALMLLGLPAPVSLARLAEMHGVLLILGFVSTLISLERATALGKVYGFAAPALLGVGGIALIIPAVPVPAAQWILVAGAAAFLALYVPLWQRQYDAALLTQLLGAGLLLVGTVLWLRQQDFELVLPWFIGYIVLTIAAERVELARITMGPRAGVTLLTAAWAIAATLVLTTVFPQAGLQVLGVLILGLTAWLVKHDVARKTIRMTGVTRYMAANILAGYVWLAVGGVVLLFGVPQTMFGYDALIHAMFLGYTFSMIMAHATTILPAVLRIDLPYRPVLWVPAGLLQVALVVRLLIGDALSLTLVWQVGGVLSVAALLLFFASAIGSAIAGPVRPGAKVAGAKVAGARQHANAVPGAPGAGSAADSASIIDADADADADAEQAGLR